MCTKTVFILVKSKGLPPDEICGCGFIGQTWRASPRVRQPQPRPAPPPRCFVCHAVHCPLRQRVHRHQPASSLVTSACCVRSPADCFSEPLTSSSAIAVVSCHTAPSCTAPPPNFRGSTPVGLDANRSKRLRMTAVRVPPVGEGIIIIKIRHHIHAAESASPLDCHTGLFSIFSRLLGACPLLHERHNFLTALRAGERQRGVAVDVTHVHVGAGLDELLDCRSVAVLAGNEQRVHACTS